jgi:hypothetical protein
MIQQQLSRYTSVICLVILCLASLGCNLVSQAVGLARTPTPSPTLTYTPTRFPTRTLTPSPTQTIIPSETATPTASFTPTPTNTFTPSPTFTPSNTPTFTPIPTSTSTPTRTPVPPTFTAGPNMLVDGRETWKLTSIEMVPEITVLGYVYPPWWFIRGPASSYLFLRLNFECTTGKTLLSLLTGEDMGLTYVHNKDGYENVYVIDNMGRKYLVMIIATCWLATPVQSTSRGFILYFNHLPPFKPTLTETIVEKSTPLP